jgi:predicted DNA-binding transcriptional regulator YafY
LQKIERLLNLMACLLDTSQPVPFEDLKETVYRGVSKGDVSVKRMFERDKDELREMGIEIDTVTSTLGDESAYIIPGDKYYLPHIDLAPDERVALTMVSRLFLGSGTPFSVPAQLALLKLAFEEQAAQGEVPHVHWVEMPRDSELLGDMLDGLMRRKYLEFSYRALGAPKPVKREVEPYGLFNRAGAWYMVGLCHLRGEVRCFKLERITSDIAVNKVQPKTPDFEVPAGFDMRAEVDWDSDLPDADIQATVMFNPRLAFAASTGFDRLVSQDWKEDGSLLATYRVADPDQFVEWVLGFGTDALITSPAEVVAMARGKLEGALGELRSG